jgi:hypothetical protein
VRSGLRWYPQWRAFFQMLQIVASSASEFLAIEVGFIMMLAVLQAGFGLACCRIATEHADRNRSRVFEQPAGSGGAVPERSGCSAFRYAPTNGAALGLPNSEWASALSVISRGTMMFPAAPGKNMGRTA